MTSKAFKRLTTVSASTKRRPDAVNGIVGEPEVYLTGLLCTPLDPIDAELRQRIPSLSGKIELLRTFLQGAPDIVEGDVLVVDSKDYPVRAAEEWYWRPDGENCVHLILEDLK